MGADRLLEVLTSRETSEYDCVVPLSGGKDSSYVLFYVAKRLGLKPLALFFDNGFITDIARRNVATICRNLQVDLVSGRASKFRRKLLREALCMSRSLGKFVKVCGNCENNLRAFAINEATARKIPFIVWGSTDYEDSAMTFLDSESPTFRQSYGAVTGLAKIVRQLPLLELLSHLSFADKCGTVLHGVKYIYYCVRDNIEMKAPEGWKRLSPLLEVSFEGKAVEAIYFYDYAEYDPYQQIEILRKETGWDAPFGKESRLDCKLHAFSSYAHLQATGISAVGFSLAVLVRSGLLSRADAMVREEIARRNLKEECRKVSEELGIDLENMWNT